MHFCRKPTCAKLTTCCQVCFLKRFIHWTFKPFKLEQRPDSACHLHSLLFSPVRKFGVIDVCRARQAVGCCSTVDHTAFFLCVSLGFVFFFVASCPFPPSEGRAGPPASSLSKIAIINLCLGLPRPPLSSIKRAEVTVQLTLLPCLLYSRCSFLLSC